MTVPSQALYEYIFDQRLASSLQPVACLLRDPQISEILINGPDQIYCERSGALQRVDAHYDSAEELENLCQSLAQYVRKEFSAAQPLLEARLPDGSRVTAIGPPVARAGIQISIRRFCRSSLSPEQLLAWRCITEEALAYLQRCLEQKRNLVIAGGTGSGKSTLLQALCSCLPTDERLVVLEDVSELQIPNDHVLYLETRPADSRGRGRISMRDLVRVVLRMRPDRIILGEVRGEEALDLVAALTSGHGGSLTTLHANFAIDALHRLETMCLTSDVKLTLPALRGQIVSAIDVIVQISRLRDGSRRILGIYETRGLDAQGAYRLCPRFLFRTEPGATGVLDGNLQACSGDEDGAAAA